VQACIPRIVEVLEEIRRLKLVVPELANAAELPESASSTPFLACLYLQSA